MSAGLLACIAVACFPAHAQERAKPKPPRAKPPEFDGSSLDGIFFDDVNSVLVGPFPKAEQTSDSTSDGSRTAAEGNSTPLNPPPGDSTQAEPAKPEVAWSTFVSTDTVEALVKDAKQRLDKAVTTPTGFASNGFQEAYREFSLLTLLFAILESHPDESRLKKNATAARLAFGMAAGEATEGTRAAFDRSKSHRQELETVLGGGSLAAPKGDHGIEWSKIIELSPLMKQLEFASQQHLTKHTANSNEFSKKKDELTRYADLVAVLAHTATIDGMPYSDDDDYRAMALEMLTSAQKVRTAIDDNDADAARLAAAQIGQACQRCHSEYR